MKKISKILIIVFCIIIGPFLLSFLIKEEPKTKPVNQGVVANIKKSVDTSSWINYSNSVLGFSIKIPLEVPTLYRCDNKQAGNTPLRVFEDNQSGAVYISQEYYYDANWSQAEQKFIGGCDKINYSLELLKREEATKYLSGLASHPFLGWKIIIDNPKSENEVDNFVKKNFGSNCGIISKDLQEDGNYQIKIKGRDLIENGAGVMDENCYTNFVYKIIYSPEKNKLMSTILGQECTFGTDPSIRSSYQCYDDTIIKSFKFN
jgi:hypothetical protein